jgi:hypothetical protein
LSIRSRTRFLPLAITFWPSSWAFLHADIPTARQGGAPSPTRAPALQLLGAAADGCTEGFAHGVIIELIAALAMWPGVPFPADATLI